MKNQLIPYQKRDGTCPVDEFIDSLNQKDSAKVLRAMLILEELGLRAGAPLVKHLQDGIFELRVKQSSNIQRIMLFHWFQGNLILLHGFTKKTQKTPSSELERAKRYRADFLIRYAKEQIQDYLVEITERRGTNHE
ncbi:type II toxin-antitoxin system RelE/ParE family toxin [Thermoactinomyces sp. DSM 45892]|uniref:type II toxin-antitoxin system RelE/ParE family toxin n=1 Tax=Thermoactinomyces sp. DSM 45892 TaxID=1882753 RepID=UPI0008968A89|nr:type II toxin-antitoxin system RelE/ParE family toxin [Thermoactinomyces sp. DSM 45892]SDY12912.1 Phage-related protein [Thermoactinomyces sp. DSM 45892]